ncbi:acetoin utilization protein AcuC [Salinibacter grassmerensis]|uniref:acetoin utilization protein AcuC n=1 Tax=Salinibacter grassmerensis TaxID=3040353 RepID=UPI0021E7EFB1|nr:acetoin utilization protein AcuC [Salinibacter grassmerensis]
MATFLFHDRYLDYHFGPQHPFSPVRQEMTMDLLETLGVPLDPVAPPVATREEVRRVHGERFVEKVEAASDGTPPPQARSFGLNTGDVPVFENMDAAARGLVGGTLHAGRLIAEGDATRVLQFGGGLHHAHRARASGFCVYNDLSVAIDALREQGLRVAYVDVDVHHGDGVQHLHDEDPGVLTVSLHETGRSLFPGTGHVEEIGEGAGRGFSLNVPLAPYTETDSYLDAFEHVVPYALQHFQPDVIVAQCGADAHFEDPLADLLLTTQAYETIFRRLLALSDDHAEGRLLCTLGGGYRLDAVSRIWALLALTMMDRELPETLPDAWCERWQARLDDPLTPTLHDPDRDFNVERRSSIEDRNRRTSEQALEQVASCWNYA